MSSSWGNQPRYGEFEIVGARENKSRPLGEGSFGKTFEAVRTDNVAGGVIKEHVALKVLKPDLLANQTKRFQFIQELVALTRFKHSNLIHYIRCGEEHGEVYYAMELCRGGDLTRLINAYGALHEKVAALIGLQVVTGLREVHQRHRLIHRDIKPSNIMLVDELEAGLATQHLAYRFEEQDSLCRIVDFGLVDFALNAQDEGNRSSRQRFAGSPMYASPEQVCEQPVDGRSDIYSLGMTLWFLVQGKGPLLDAQGRELRDHKEAMRRHIKMDQEHVGDFPTHLSDGFRRILAKMVAKKPENRYANAGEVQKALREYLSEAANHQEPSFSVTRSTAPLDQEYKLQNVFPSCMGRKSYVAEHLSSGRKVKLTVVKDFEGGDLAQDAEAMAQHLSGLAEISLLPSLPGALLHVQEVVFSSDMLAYAEDLPEHVPLAEVLRARASQRRSTPFSEAVVALRPIAEALDFLMQHGRNKIYLACEEVWVNCEQMAKSAAGDPQILLRPLTEWRGFTAHFSMMWLPPNARTDDMGAGSSWVHQTISGSLQLSDSVCHPVPAFCRLVYRILTGSEVAAAAEFAPMAYVQTVALGAASNNLIRDILCQQQERPNATAVLAELCAHEGVVRTPTFFPLGNSSGNPTSSTGPKVSVPGELVCEIIFPGLARSPYDAQKREVEIAAKQWQPTSRIQCPFTQKFFRLPKKLAPLLAKVVGPGMVHSPYAEPGEDMPVPWELWAPGGEIVCAETGKKIHLPDDLPLPTGSLVPEAVGKVLSPYASGTQVSVALESWVPGAQITCPVTALAFLLPTELPPFEALAEIERPGVLATPYAPQQTWTIEPAEWVPGRLVTCPQTQRPLKLPAVVEQWIPQAKEVNAFQRTVGNPFRPGATIPVPVEAWKPGGTVVCPETQRVIRLPESLPPLTGEIVEGKLGMVRSPYTGETVSVHFKDWVPGGSVVCPKSKNTFLLPATLPEWIPTGSVTALRPGYVQNPYDLTVEIAVSASEWMPGQILKCPASGRSFRLPASLPNLPALIKPGRFGVVGSPFAPDQECKVSLDDWQSGFRLECPVTHRDFVLPDHIEEWIVDGTWMPLMPGKLHSPFQSHPVVTTTVADWEAGALLICPATKRPFRIPAAVPLPPLGLEHDAVTYALGEVECSEDSTAAHFKDKYSAVTPELVRSIWMRHGLETAEKRRRAQEVGETVPGEPGFARSPYGSKPKVEITPRQWSEPNAAVLCPETGRRFLLPENLPPLRAVLRPEQPGTLASPYQPEALFQAAPDEWVPGGMIRCPHTGHPLQLPANLPEWVPEGTTTEGTPNEVSSPYGSKRRMTVPTGQWNPGQILRCPQTGKNFRLPATLAPLPAVNLQPGSLESPYVAGHRFELSADQWQPGMMLECPVTHRPIKLPENLPAKDWVGEVIAEQPGVVRSPYGSKREVVVAGTKWRARTRCDCPETGKPFILPDVLPPLEALFAGTLGKVVSPYVPSQALLSTIAVSIAQWEPGRQFLCASTGLPCVLPANLPPWEVEASLNPERPGIVQSPYRPAQNISVPPDQWNPGERLLCPVSKRFFSLPFELPPLEARIVKNKPGFITSPYDEKGPVQAVPGENWVPGKLITCQKTGRELLLPKELPELLLEGALIQSRPLFVRSPYGRHAEVAVTGSAWAPGTRIPCPESGRTFVLPGNLPPLVGSVIGNTTGRVLSPYADATEVRVPHRRWLPGARVTCSATRRVFLLPDKLPFWQKPPSRLWPIAMASLFFLAFVGAGGGIWYWLTHRPMVIETPPVVINSPPTKTDNPPPVIKPPVVVTPPVVINNPPPKIDNPPPVIKPPVVVTPPPVVVINPLADLISLRKEVEQAGGNLDQDLARKYCAEIVKKLPKITEPSERAEWAGQYATVKLKLIEKQTDARAPSEIRDKVLQYLKAGVLNDADGTSVLGTVFDKPFVKVLLAALVYENADFNATKAVRELHTAAAGGRSHWAQETLKRELEAKPMAIGRRLVEDPLGLLTEGIPLSKEDWQPGKAIVTATSPPRWFHLPDQLPAAPAQIVFSDVTVEGFEQGQQPNLKVVIDRKEYEGVASASQMTVTLGLGEAPKKTSTVELRLPGWKPVRTTLVPDSEGDYLDKNPLKLEHQAAPLPLRIGRKGTDYDFVNAEWLGPLEGETAPQQSPGIFRIKTTDISESGLAKPLPTGSYELKYESQQPQRIKAYVLPERVEVTTDRGKPQTKLPPSFTRPLVGLIVGVKPPNQEKSTGRFFVLNTNVRDGTGEISILVVPGIQEGQEISSEGNYLIPGTYWRLSNITIPAANVMEFDAPANNIDHHFKVIFDEGRNYWLMSLESILPKSDEDFVQARQRMIKWGQDSFTEAKKNPGEFDPVVAKYQSYKDLPSYQCINNLETYHAFVELFKKEPKLRPIPLGGSISLKRVIIEDADRSDWEGAPLVAPVWP